MRRREFISLLGGRQTLMTDCNLRPLRRLFDGEPWSVFLIGRLGLEKEPSNDECSC
jgi:hypothetical protein